MFGSVTNTVSPSRFPIVDLHSFFVRFGLDENTNYTEFPQHTVHQMWGS